MSSTSRPTEAQAWHRLTGDAAAARLDVAPERGLNGAEAARRLASHGPNAALAECVLERDILLGDFERRKQMLPEDIVAAVEGDLFVIDSAVAEIQSALDADPGNEQLEQMLVMTCEKQAGLLAQVMRLANPA